MNIQNQKDHQNIYVMMQCNATKLNYWIVQYLKSKFVIGENLIGRVSSVVLFQSAVNQSE